MKRHVKFDLVRVEYVHREPELTGEENFVIAGLDGTKDWVVDEQDLPPEIPHMVHEASTRYGLEGGSFYLAENGEVYPQFRMEER